MHSRPRGFLRGAITTAAFQMATLIDSPRRSLVVICLTSAAWAFGFGVSSPLASLVMHRAGCSDTLIGLNTAIYYFGLAGSALLAPAALRRHGAACAAVGMVVAGLAVALFPIGAGVPWWFALRLLGGMAGAFSVIPMETFVNRDLPAADRARNFGLYAVALTLGWSLGNYVGLELASSAIRLAFLLGGLASLMAGVAVQLALPAIPACHAGPHAATPIDLRSNLLSFGSAWSQGFLEGGMIAFLSLYLLGLGLTEQHAGLLVSTSMVGVLLFQVPVAWLADRLGRMPVLLACYGAVAVAMVGLPLAGASWLLPPWLFVMGACSGAFYPLGLALLGERLPESELDRANAYYLSLECVGSLMGPALMGAARDWIGEGAMFAVGEAAVLAVLASWWLLGRRATPVAVPANAMADERQAA